MSGWGISKMTALNQTVCPICAQQVPVRQNRTIVTHKIKTSNPRKGHIPGQTCKGSDKEI